jgi:hypothetical protein
LFGRKLGGAEPCHGRVDAVVALKHATYSRFHI